MTDANGSYTTTPESRLGINLPPLTERDNGLVFMSGNLLDRREVGRLYITPHGLVFEGDAEPSAEAFITLLDQLWQKYQQQQKEGV